MPASRMLLPLFLSASLAACEARIAKDADQPATGQAAAEIASADGKAKEGQFSIDAPGVDMKIDIPEGIGSNGQSDSDILYPGSTMSGMHIQAGSGGNGKAGVELRFTSADAPERVAAWYRDPARASVFSIASVRNEGDAMIITGTEKGDKDPFTLRLMPGSGGGTDGRLILTDRG